jgi:hypothetical protein
MNVSLHNENGPTASKVSSRKLQNSANDLARRITSPPIQKDEM